MASSSRPVALVTGASSGIGEVLAACFAQSGHDLVLVARSADRLATLADRLSADHGVRVRVEPADLSLPGVAQALALTLRRKRVTVDVLVNNAGVLEQGAFVDIGAASHQGIIALNVAGLTAMLDAFVPAMVERRRGRVLNVASIAAFQPVPALAVYAASKAYVLSLSESLVEELRGTGVSVTALCPGITATPMLSNATQANERLSRLPAFVVGRVEDVARQGHDACLRGDAICVPGTANLAATITARATPKWLVRRIAGMLGRGAL